MVEHDDSILSYVGSVGLFGNMTYLTTNSKIVGDEDTLYAVNFNGAGRNITVLTNMGNVTHAIDTYNAKVMGRQGNEKRGLVNTGPNWVSFEAYGMNMDLCRNYEYLNHQVASQAGGVLGNYIGTTNYYAYGSYTVGVASKGCLTWGDSDTEGQGSMIVGEYYWADYGGIDSQCDSL